MRTVSFILITLILPLMNIFGQGHDRQPVVAGSFYPSESDKLKKELSAFFAKAGEPVRGVRVRALIVPHAGYIYSGGTAASGFAAVPSDAEYDNIFLIGVSHRYGFEGAAVFTSGDLITPLGKVTVNKELGEKLKSTNKWFIEKDEAHGPEHSLEVELPFIQYHLRHEPKVVPILIGTRSQSVLKAIAGGLKPWFNDRNLFVISSDFSHYPPYDEAVRADRMTSDAIIKGDPDDFLRTIRKVESSGIENLATAMCGWPAALVLLYLAENEHDLSFRNAGYTNSGNSHYGSKDEVVGYNAIVLEEKPAATASPDAVDSFSLTKEEEHVLSGIAREAILAHLKDGKPPATDPSKLTPRLKEPLGAFVTITKNGSLRGCIGRFTSPDPLYKVVGEMALAAAFNDPRFPPLRMDEFADIHIEISVLGPMKRIHSASEVIIGRHGIYMKKGYRNGTLLPQVATERGWTVDEFLGYCARDKAGIGWEGWKDKDTELYVYEAYVFGEQED